MENKQELNLIKIKEVYEKYKNMEEAILSYNGNRQISEIMKDLWLAVKYFLEYVPKKGAK